MSLDAEKDDVRLANRGEIAGRLHRHLEVAVRAEHSQPALLHSFQMRTAREQHDVGAGLCQPGADVTADGPRSRDDDLHECPGVAHAFRRASAALKRCATSITSTPSPR